jgi:hypothetical protein
MTEGNRARKNRWRHGRRILKRSFQQKGTAPDDVSTHRPARPRNRDFECYRDVATVVLDEVITSGTQAPPACTCPLEHSPCSRAEPLTSRKSHPLGKNCNCRARRPVKQPKQEMTFVYFPPSSQHPSPEPCVKSRGSYWLSQTSFPVTLIFGQQLTMCSSWSFPLFPTRARLSRRNLHHTFRLFIESQFGLPTWDM